MISLQRCIVNVIFVYSFVVLLGSNGNSCEAGYCLAQVIPRVNHIERYDRIERLLSGVLCVLMIMMFMIEHMKKMMKCMNQPFILEGIDSFA